MNLEHLESIRLYELEIIINEINNKSEQNIILEIGAGSGWQAKKLSERGFQVKAIDIESSKYINHRNWPIIEYDGKSIPFPDNHFDIIFSSNVLEHIFNLYELSDEMKRVLKPNGIAIHILPSGSLRFWMTITHYPFVIKTVLFLMYRSIANVVKHKSPDKSELCVLEQINRYSKTKRIIKAIFPYRHGEVGNAITEMYYFSKLRWIKFFKKTGWAIKKIFTNRLFYSGHSILGPSLSISSRNRVANILGSSSNVFILKKVKN